GANNGFSVENGSIHDTDRYTADTAATNDDVFCAVIQAGTFDPDNDLTHTVLRWTYLPDGAPSEVELPIDLFVARLVAKNGVLGGAAEVCTAGYQSTENPNLPPLPGWDSNILNGRQSTEDNAGTIPQPIDDVTLGNTPADFDWLISGGLPNPPTITKF